MKEKVLLVAIAIVLAAGMAQAQIFNEPCATDRQGVASDILWLKSQTLCGSAFLGDDPLFVYKRNPNCLIQERLVRKLDDEPVNPRFPRRGAMTKMLQGKDETAIEYLQDYIDAIAKSTVVEDREEQAQDLADAAAFLQVCVEGVAGQPPVLP